MACWPDRGLRMAAKCLVLTSMATLAVPSAAGVLKPRVSGCDSFTSSEVKLDQPRVVQKGASTTTSNSSSWYFEPPKSGDLSIAVTPLSRLMDPNIELYAYANNSCYLVTVAKDYGGNLILLRETTVKELKSLRYFLNVTCTSPACEYHVSFHQGDEKVWENISAG
eukprot:CAMPEP_0195136678 /NCGR_PEP_ID=MMETSP0448-20130528/154651_1 /TAXON_ID=66468 /ORGANISM="Heterocapsa triquestra, Strain CCMP 448" /LENGTH=165 /DNA_ID=CAMNT_0040174875 /DNA_START=23 /DNA_END=516 /DNA_ORIENTATION=-